jgi:hypothetical protein
MNIIDKKIKFIFIVVSAMMIITSYSPALVTGHYETNGKGCYIAKSLLGGKAQVCNCLPNEKPIIVGAIITSISTCNADSISFHDIDFFKIPSKLQPEARDYLGKYRVFLQSIGTEKSKKIADIILTFFETIRSQSISLYNQCEIDYLVTYDSMSSEEKSKIMNWLKANPF